MLDYTPAADHGGKVTSSRQYSPEEIVNRLREEDVLLAKGKTVAQARKWIDGMGFILSEAPRPPGTIED